MLTHAHLATNQVFWWQSWWRDHLATAFLVQVAVCVPPDCQVFHPAVIRSFLGNRYLFQITFSYHLATWHRACTHDRQYIWPIASGTLINSQMTLCISSLLSLIFYLSLSLPRKNTLGGFLSRDHTSHECVHLTNWTFNYLPRVTSRPPTNSLQPTN